MAINLYQYLVEDGKSLNMPHITISKRPTDKQVVYDKKRNRLDRIAGNIYQDEAYWRLILWANPNYSLEFDIPDNTVIRVPFPLIDIEQEVVEQIISKSKR